MRCNCESIHCTNHNNHAVAVHDDQRYEYCKSSADPRLLLMYVGAVCPKCYEACPSEYRLPKLKEVPNG